MSEGPRVLIVDDEPQIRRFLRTGLGGHNFQVLEANTGRGALEQIAALKPDLVILDLGLPDLDGIQVIRELREWSQIPVIVLSVRDREQEKIQASTPARMII